MAANRFAMNPAKTDVLCCSTSHQPSDSPLTLAGVTVLPSSEVRNLGVVFDSDLSLKAHVSQLTSRCYSCLRRIKSCRRALTLIPAAIWQAAPNTLDKLQRVLNCSARVIFGGDSRHHVTPLLHDHLHWLRARERISFKLCILRIQGSPQPGTVLFRLFPTFPLSVPLLVVIWWYQEQVYNSATGHFVWLVRSPGTVYHWTLIVQHLHYQLWKTCSSHIFFTFLLYWLTVSRVRAANIVRRPCSDSSHVNEPYKLLFYYYYFFLINKLHSLLIMMKASLFRF